MKINFKVSRKRKRQVLGIAIGLFISCLTYVFLSVPQNEHLLAKGPMNTGHENLECQDCHTKAKGNVFQQAQANISHLFGLRRTPVDFGHKNVDNQKCQSCHDRPNDRHPIHRFEEPKFFEARKNIQPTQCESCHSEHDGIRVTISTSAYCVNCHTDTELSDDPLEISHVELIKNNEWQTCLQCHDFHGNHVMETAASMKDTIEIKTILDYFEGGPSPYSEKKKYYANENPE